ncbi:MAG: hypothetical protein ACE5H5_00405 [Nitrospinota bacterium]
MPRDRSCSMASVALVLTLLAHPAGGAASEGSTPKALDRLVEAVLEAHGGQKALRAVQALKVVGRLKAVVRGDEGTATIHFQHPDKLYSENAYGGRREVRIVNGSQGWIKTGGTFQLVPPDAMLAMRYSLITYRLPLELATRREDLTYLGRVEQGGRRFEVLELSYPNTIMVRVFLESASKRIAQVAGYITAGGKTFILSRVLDDYREVAGVAYPFHQRYYSGRRLLAEKWVEAVETNPRQPEGLFRPK